MDIPNLVLSLRCCQSNRGEPKCSACPATELDGDCIGDIMEQAANILAEHLILQAKADALEKEVKKYKGIEL